jgi:hypothetical protein
MSASERGRRGPRLDVVRIYEPDPARCVTGVAMVLRWAAERRARDAAAASEPTTTTSTVAATDAAPPATAPPGAGREETAGL